MFPVIQSELAPEVRMDSHIPGSVKRLFRKAEQGFSVNIKAFFDRFGIKTIVLTISIAIAFQEQLLIITETSKFTLIETRLN